MGSKILAFRTAVVVDRLPARSDACVLSLRDVLAAPVAGRRPIPMVLAPVAGVARAALVAAREAEAVIGLAMPAGTAPGAWFEAVTRAADEYAAGLPFFLSATVAIDEGGAKSEDRASAEAFRFVDAGITHLAVDARKAAPPERARILAAAGAPAAEQGACVDLVLGLEEPPRELFAEMARTGATLDAVSVRCPEVRTQKEARAQVVRLVRLSAELKGLPVLRRGPVSPELLEELARSPVRGCEDGDAASGAGLSVIPRDRIERHREGASRSPALDLAAAELPSAEADRLEARAYVEVASLIELLGAAGSATALTTALEALLEDR